MQSFSDVLALVKEYFQEKVRTNQLTETAYTCWIENIQPGRFENNTAFLVVSFEFHRSILMSQYLEPLQEAFTQVLGFPVKVEILCIADAMKPAAPAQESAAPVAKAEPTFSESEKAALPYISRPITETDMGIGEYEYTFDTFIVAHLPAFVNSKMLL